MRAAARDARTGSRGRVRGTLDVPDAPAGVDDGSFTGTPDCGVMIEDLLYYPKIFDAGGYDEPCGSP